MYKEFSQPIGSVSAQSTQQYKMSDNTSRMEELRQRRMRKLPLLCFHRTAYLTAHPTCEGQTEMCLEKCMRAGHLEEKHEIIDKEDFVLGLKAQKDRKIQMISGFIESLKSIYEERQAYLFNVYMDTKKQVEALCFDDEEVRLMEYIHNDKLAVLECNHIYFLQHINSDKKQVDKKAQQIVEKFKKLFTQVVPAKPNQEFDKNMVREVLMTVKNQFKDKVDEQRRIYIKKHIELEQTCKKMETELKDLRKKYESQLELRKNTINLTQNSTQTPTPTPTTQSQSGNTSRPATNYSAPVSSSQRKQPELSKKIMPQQTRVDPRIKQAQFEKKSPGKMVDESETRRSTVNSSVPMPKTTTQSSAHTTASSNISNKPNTNVSSSANTSTNNNNNNNNTSTPNSSKATTEKPITSIDRERLQQISQSYRSKIDTHHHQPSSQSSANLKNSNGQAKINESKTNNYQAYENKNQNPSTQVKDPTFPSVFHSSNDNSAKPSAPKFPLNFSPASQKLSPIPKAPTQAKQQQTPTFNMTFGSETQPTIKTQTEQNIRARKRMDDFGLQDDSELPQFGFKHPNNDCNIEFTPVFSNKAQPNIEQFYFKKKNNENPPPQ